jgi:hypothetical protein
MIRYGLNRPVPRTGRAGVKAPSGSTVAVTVEGLEIVVEGPIGDLVAHLHSGRVREPKVDPQPDPGADHVLVELLRRVVMAGGARNGRGDQGQVQVSRPKVRASARVNAPVMPEYPLT